MLSDAYGNSIGTDSDEASAAYDLGVRRFLGAEAGVAEAFRTAIAHDEGFALAHIGLAREMQLHQNREAVKASLARAESLADGLCERERSHIEVSGLLLRGKGPDARAGVYEHIDRWPRDVMIAHMCTSVFGLIGFSGLKGREAEQLAFNTKLAMALSDDWWCTAQLAFAQLEVGRLDEAEANIEAALTANPASAHSVHIKAHLLYEAQRDVEGLNYLTGWWDGYDPSATLHNHVSWHVGLWSLETGDIDQMWDVLDTKIGPEVSQGPPLNVMTDAAALMLRAELAGVEVPVERWTRLSDYSLSWFPRSGLAFADVHAAIAHARSGNRSALNDLVQDAKGPAGDMTRAIAEGYAEMEDGNFGRAADRFLGVIADHERIGGSNAQRDLIDYSLAACLVKDGRRDEARNLLAITRPRALESHAVAGL